MCCKYILKYGIYFLVMRQRLSQNLTSNRVSIFNNALFQTHISPTQLQPQCSIQLHPPSLCIPDDDRNSGTIKHQTINRRPYTSFIEHRNKIFSTSNFNNNNKKETKGLEPAQLVRDRSSSRKKNKIFEEYYPKQYRPGIKAVTFNEELQSSERRESKDVQLQDVKVAIKDRHRIQQDIVRKCNVGTDKTQSSSQRSYQESNLILQLKNKQVLTPDELTHLVKHIRKSGSFKPINNIRNPTVNDQYHTVKRRP